ncbi:MAG TPA: GNAT family N-acetyltransferase [Methyloradius sp.]|nr:GNAT family N-acetyltransferase [Methyloradius sp.]
MITTRIATSEDQIFIYDLYVEAIKGYVEQLWGWDEIWQKNDFSAAFQSATTYVIQIGSEVSGYFQLELGTEFDYLRMFILGKEYRSKGIGSIVLQDVLRSSQINHKTLKLRVFKINTDALRFYQREGWHITQIEDAFYLLEHLNMPII